MTKKEILRDFEASLWVVLSTAKHYPAFAEYLNIKEYKKVYEKIKKELSK